jgi:hypothetical protein
MKHLFSPALILIAAAVLIPQALPAQIVQIDFRAFRGTSESEPGNFSGPSGFAGGGTTYNGLVADNSATTDNIFVSGTNLVDSFNHPTSVSFSTGPVGADNSGIGVLNGSYLFTDSALSLVPSAPFTIGGLKQVPTVNLIFFTTQTNGINVPRLTFNGSTTAAVPSSVVNNYTYEFDNVPVIYVPGIGGEVTGTIGTPNPTPFGATPLIFSGLAIQEAPEPSTYALMIGGLALLGFCIRRKSAATKA